MWAWPPARPVVLLDVCDDTRCPPFRQQAMRKLVAELHHLHRQHSAKGPACLLHSPSCLLPRLPAIQSYPPLQFDLDFRKAHGLGTISKGM